MTDRKLENRILWVVLLITFFVLFIIIIEAFEFNKDRISLYISALGALGAVSAAIAAAMSTNLAKNSIERQQQEFEKSLEPFIVPVIKNFIFPGENLKPKLVVTRWDNEDSNTSIDHDLEIPIINIANGVAKNIVVNFEIRNYKEIVENYEETADVDETDILELQMDEVSHHGDMTEQVYVSFQSLNKTEFAGVIQASNFPNQDIHFMHKEIQEESKVSVPILFIVLNNLSLYQMHKGRLVTKPELIMNITCQDIADNYYEFNYRIYLRNSHYFEDSQSSRMEIKMSVDKIE